MIAIFQKKTKTCLVASCISSPMTNNSSEEVVPFASNIYLYFVLKDQSQSHRILVTGLVKFNVRSVDISNIMSDPTWMLVGH